MKSLRLGAGLTICFLVPSILAQPAKEPQLRGIVCTEDQAVAILDLGGTARNPSTSILKSGQSEHGYEVTTIDERSGRVILRESKSGRGFDLKLALAPGEELVKRTLHFQSARLASVLDIYQMLSRRTVIRSFPFPQAVLSLKSSASLPSQNALEILDAAIADKGVVMKPRGEKFVFAVRSNDAKLLDEIPNPPAVDASVTASELLPLGAPRFFGADAFQVLELYAELSGRTVLVSRDLRGGNITVAGQTQLTRKEAVWLMDAVFRLADVVMVPESSNFVFAVRPTGTNHLPTFDANAAQAKVRKVSPPGLMNIRSVDPKQLLDVYAAVLGREALPVETSIPGSFSLHTVQPLNQAEVVFALEALARLSNCKLELVGDDKVQLLPATAPPQ